MTQFNVEGVTPILGERGYDERNRVACTQAILGTNADSATSCAEAGVFVQVAEKCEGVAKKNGIILDGLGGKKDKAGERDDENRFFYQIDQDSASSRFTLEQSTMVTSSSHLSSLPDAMEIEDERCPLFLLQPHQSSRTIAAQNKQVKPSRSLNPLQEMDQKIDRAFQMYHDNQLVSLATIAHQTGVSKRTIESYIPVIRNCLKGRFKGAFLSDQEIVTICQLHNVYVDPSRIQRLLVEARKHKDIYVPSGKTSSQTSRHASSSGEATPFIVPTTPALTQPKSSVSDPADSNDLTNWDEINLEEIFDDGFRVPDRSELDRLEEKPLDSPICPPTTSEETTLPSWSIGNSEINLGEIFDDGFWVSDNSELNRVEKKPLDSPIYSPTTSLTATSEETTVSSWPQEGIFIPPSQSSSKDAPGEVVGSKSDEKGDGVSKTKKRKQPEIQSSETSSSNSKNPQQKSKNGRLDGAKAMDKKEKRVAKKVSNIDQRYAKALELIYSNPKLSLKEIAEQTGCDRNTLSKYKKAIARCLELKNELGLQFTDDKIEEVCGQYRVKKKIIERLLNQEPTFKTSKSHVENAATEKRVAKKVAEKDLPDMEQRYDNAFALIHSHSDLPSWSIGNSEINLGEIFDDVFLVPDRSELDRLEEKPLDSPIYSPTTSLTATSEETTVSSWPQEGIFIPPSQSSSKDAPGEVVGSKSDEKGDGVSKTKKRKRPEIQSSETSSSNSKNPQQKSKNGRLDGAKAMDKKEKRVTKKDKRNQKYDKALELIYSNPKLSLIEIAEQTGCDSGNLSKYKKAIARCLELEKEFGRGQLTEDQISGAYPKKRLDVEKIKRVLDKARTLKDKSVYFKSNEKVGRTSKSKNTTKAPERIDFESRLNAAFEAWHTTTKSMREIAQESAISHTTFSRYIYAIAERLEQENKLSNPRSEREIETTYGKNDAKNNIITEWLPKARKNKERYSEALAKKTQRVAKEDVETAYDNAFALIHNNPNLSLKDIATKTGCDRANLSRYKAAIVQCLKLEQDSRLPVDEQIRKVDPKNRLNWERMRRLLDKARTLKEPILIK